MYTLLPFFDLLFFALSHTPSLPLPLHTVASCLPLTMSVVILETPLLNLAWSVRGHLLVRGKRQSSRTPSLNTVVTSLLPNEQAPTSDLSAVGCRGLMVTETPGLLHYLTASTKCDLCYYFLRGLIRGLRN